MKRVANHREAGYSMGELAVVVAVVGIAATLAASDLRSLSKGYQEQATAVQVQDYFYEARSLARSLISEVTVYWQDGVLILDASPYDVRGYALAPAVEDVVIGTADGTLVYNPDGGTTEANPTNVVVTTSRGQVYRLTIYPAIGTVRMGKL